MGRQALWILLDALAIALSMLFAFFLRFDAVIPSHLLDLLLLAMGLAVVLKIAAFVPFRLYRFSWRHVGIRELINVAAACSVGSAALAALILLLRGKLGFEAFPRSVLIIDAVICFVIIGGIRLSGRLARVGSMGIGHREGQRVLIVGAGEAAAQLVRAIQEEAPRPYLPVGLIDDDPSKLGRLVYGVRVLGSRSEIPRLVNRLDVKAVLVAIPSASASTVRETVDLARRGGIRDIKILPVLSEIYAGRVDLQALRELRPEDLLRRDPVRIESEAIRAFLDGKSVLVTGAAGSIGSELCRQVLAFGAERLVALDFDETGLFDLDADLENRFRGKDVDVVVCDVRDADALARAFDRASPEVVYHAAAYKHVPMMEAFPSEAAKTNVLGTRNALAAACEVDSEAFVLISTDKAVRPSSVMGATKRIAEMLVQSRTGDRPRSIAVRFGNVLGSRGSVLQTFKRQVEERRPVTVTDPEMRRFFMVTSEAVQLVLQASVLGTTGHVLVLDMGKPVEIVEFARDVIRFYGYEPDVDIPIVFTGVRPGEKLYEDLFTDAEGRDSTSHERVHVARLESPDAGWETHVETLVGAALRGDDRSVLDSLKRIVPGFRTDDAESPDVSSGS